VTTLTQALTHGVKRLAAAGVNSARLDARVLLAHAMGIEVNALLGRIEPSAFQMEEYGVLIDRRAHREPIAYIVGTKEFWSLSLDVGPGVLVPRPETETLVEQALREFPDRAARLRAADFGTGSGAILLAFLSEYRNATGLGIDRAADALSWARRSAAKLGVGDRCTFLQANWSMSSGQFDLIFSNPPYLTSAEFAAAPAELCFEPREALDAGPDGLAAYRALAPLLAARLRPEGSAFLEIGLGQGDAVTAILAAAGLETLRITPDLAGIPRCVVAGLEKTLGKQDPSL
jgi:release factor glutamine methyltransferase